MLFAHVGLLVHGIFYHFPNVDEIAHLPAGVSHWAFVRFDLYKVSPPLVQVVSGLPRYLLGETYDWTLYSVDPGVRPEFVIGRDRLQQAGLGIHREFILPRLFCVPFSILGAVVLTIWCNRLFGRLSAHVVCAFWCFCPNILAHAQTIIPDVGSVTMGLIAAYGYWTYWKTPTIGNAAWAGFLFGLALLTKLTWLTGVVSFPLAMGLCLALDRQQLAARPWRMRLVDLFISHSVALFILNDGYFFEGTLTPLGEFRFCSESLGGPGTTLRKPGNRFTETWMAVIPVPVPRNYLQGIDFLRYEVETRYWSFLFGEWRKGSWWYYYLITTLVKTPIPTLLAVGLGAAAFWRHWSTQAKCALILLGLPAFVAFASISLQGGFNHHHRYVLQIYPPLYLLAAGCAQTSLRRSWWSRLCVTLCCLSAMASLSVWPHYLGFFNQSVGGPREGWKVLGFSNIDWGQDLLVVDRWIQEHPTARPCSVQSEFFNVDNSFFGLPKANIPRLPLRSNPPISTEAAPAANRQPAPLPEDGWYIINVRQLYDLPGHSGLGYFRLLEPTDRIGYSFMIYHVGDAEREKISRAL